MEHERNREMKKLSDIKEKKLTSLKGELPSTLNELKKIEQDNIPSE